MARGQSSQIIQEAQAKLSSEWGRTTGVWRDEVASKFAREFWMPLESSIANYFKAVEELEDALEKVADIHRL